MKAPQHHLSPRSGVAVGIRSVFIFTTPRPTESTSGGVMIRDFDAISADAKHNKIHEIRIKCIFFKTWSNATSHILKNEISKYIYNNIVYIILREKYLLGSF